MGIDIEPWREEVEEESEDIADMSVLTVVCWRAVELMAEWSPESLGARAVRANVAHTSVLSSSKRQGPTSREHAQKRAHDGASRPLQHRKSFWNSERPLDAATIA